MYATPIRATVTIIAGSPMRRILARTMRMTQTVTITNAIPVEYSYILPSGQWPASSARVKIEAKWIGQPMRTRAIPMSPRMRFRNARWSTKATTASVYAATAIPNRTRDAGVLDMPAGEYSHGRCRGGLAVGCLDLESDL